MLGDQEGLKIDVLMPVGLVLLKVKGSLFFPFRLNMAMLVFLWP